MAEVLSHLGSGAEIGLVTLHGALGGNEPAEDFNQSVWDRWNAMTPQAQESGFRDLDEQSVAAFEAVTTEQRESLEVTLGFLPFPLPLASLAGMRLNELAQHSWDVRIALDPHAQIDAATAELLAEHFSGGLSFLTGFIGKLDVLRQPAVVQIAGTDYGLVIADRVALVSEPADPTATFTGAPEAAIRLISGRLTPAHTPAGLAVTGNLTIEDLRRVFPGY